MSGERDSLRMSLSVDQAAIALGVSPRLVRNLIARGELPVVRIGRRVLVSVRTLDAYIRAHETAGEA